MALTAKALSLSDLEAYDEGVDNGGQRRFCCPLPGCVNTPVDANHRSLSLNIDSGLWYCHRCESRGKLREYWDSNSHHNRNSMKIFNGGSSQKLAESRNTDKEISSINDAWNYADDVERGPAAAYLRRRSINLVLAHKALCRLNTYFYGRSAILFPLFNSDNELIGLNGRYIDDDTPKTRIMGSAKLGIFYSDIDALNQRYIIITEAPIDALSCATAGYPAIAFNGVGLCPEWLLDRLAWKQVVIAFDSDEAGCLAADKLRMQLQTVGADVIRYTPSLKDCNEVLVTHGKEILHKEIERCIMPHPLS